MFLRPIVRIAFCVLCLTVSTLSGLAQSETITIRSVAGTSGERGVYGKNGTPATSSYLDAPTGVAVDAAGNLFISDPDNYTVYKVTAGGLLDIFAYAEWYPLGLAVDTAGVLYIADGGNMTVSKIGAAGQILTLAGNGRRGFSGDGGKATSAQFDSPNGVVVDAAGNLFISDWGNHRIRKLTLDGVINTVAGNGTPGFSGDGGPATSAQINGPTGVAVDAAGNLFIADAFNHRVRKVTPDGMIRTVAGTGALGSSGDGGPAAAAQLNYPTGVAVDPGGNLFISDQDNHRIRMVALDGKIRTLAGIGAPGFAGDGGAATSAQLNHPQAVAVDAVGNLYIADTDNGRVRKVGTSPAKTDASAGPTRDFNGDRRSDILWRDTAGNVSTWLMNGYTINADTFIANIWPGWTIAASGDFNGDGKADILWRDMNGNVATWLMDGSTITSYSNRENMPKAWAIAGVADFDANGKADILWRDTAGNVLIWLMNGHRIANYSFIATIPPDWNIAGTGDFNGDGKADILWRDSAGSVSIWLMDGTAIASYSNTVFNTSKSWTVAGVADFDGDGRADILWRDTSGTVGMWLMNGHTINEESFIANIWPGWTIAGTGDFDGDRRADILWRDTAGDVSIWLMDGTTISGYNNLGNVSDRLAQ